MDERNPLDILRMEVASNRNQGRLIVTTERWSYLRRMHTSSPIISVVMPVYNGERYVAEAVESVLAQTLRDFEFLIFDDGSTDRSLQILRSYSDEDDRIHLFSMQHRGYAAWLNEGIRVARGQFIARMDADDVSLETRFAEQFNYMKEHPICLAVGCDALVIDSQGNTLGVLRQEAEPRLIEKRLLEGTHGVLIHPSCLMRREALCTIGGYREKYEPIEDFDLWFRLLEFGQLANLPKALFKYRLNPTSVSATRFRKQQHHSDSILREARQRRRLRPLMYTSRHPIHSTNDEIASLQLQAIFLSGITNRPMAFRYAFRSLCGAPFSPSSWVTLCWIMFPQCIKDLLKAQPLRSTIAKAQQMAWRFYFRSHLM